MENQLQGMPGLLTEDEQKTFKVFQIANVCHEANKGWCSANGDYTQKAFEYAEEWQRDSAIKGNYIRVGTRGLLLYNKK